jgi:NitT/TauT family transport system permease protein
MKVADIGARAAGFPAVRRLAIAAALVACWSAYVQVTKVKAFLLPSPGAVLGAVWSDVANGRLPASVLTTLDLLFVGTLVGLALGIGLATLSILSRPGADLLSVLTSVFNPLPGVAILPLAMLWFGLTPKAVLFVVSYATVWPIALNIDVGFRTVSTTLLMVAENLGLRGIGLVLHVMIPAALPYIITGLKVAWAFGWRTVVAAELVFGVAGGRAGVGWYISQARYFLETSRVFAGLVAIATVGMAFEYVFGLLERHTVEKWGAKK